jgi:uncharacterized protein YjiS (DUF1127 family)
MTMIVRTGPNARSVSRGLAEQFWVKSIGVAWRRWLVALRAWKAEQTAIARLQSMSDRELKDIGVSRSEVGRAARDGTARHAVYHRCY